MKYLHLITIIFVVAKIIGAISFSWFYVFLPTMIAFAWALFWIIIVILGFAAASK